MMTLTEAAQSLDLSPITLRLQIRNGKLRARKLGRDWFVTEREVERYRAENKRLIQSHTHVFQDELCKCGATNAVQEQGAESVDAR